MNYNDALELMYEKLKDHKIMAIATSKDDYVMIRNVSCIIFDEKIYFKTDKNFPKTKQLLENDQVALCYHGVSLEGIAQSKGKVSNHQTFMDLYKEYWEFSYNAYEHEEDEILIEVTPLQIEIWDQDENNQAFQTIIDTVNKEAKVIFYD